ncbi:30S ribosomal protein S16 [Anaerohalosphaera lusitana]|uniref:Small ribosomal subunit protein bS16 n=1 Tax=Anaerohalosphaera lusitana TaxID=1936003 RepID=A0A1U9NPP3_9BACT|nr:30S ribosomal protein S16 [Anaerohalosphaera lusitana]AQT69879.1 30S ribosomal protein S16 [Anaerohalosphaera lusitana]
MAVKLRLTRIGRRHRPFFRIHAIESRNPRDGRILEKIGHYDPIEKDEEKQIVIDLERAKYWIEKGAVPSDTVVDILAKKGVTTKIGEARKKRRQKALEIARKKGKPFTKAEKIAAEKAAEEAAEAAKAAAEAAAKAAKEAEEAKSE